jgi:hypothetical protein
LIINVSTAYTANNPRRLSAFLKGGFLMCSNKRKWSLFLMEKKLSLAELYSRPRARKVMAVFAGLGTLAATGCHAGPSGLPPETMLVRHGQVEISAGEYDSIVFAATKFGIPVDKFGMLALCESGMDSNNTNSSHHTGLFSQAEEYWKARVAHYIAVVHENPGDNIRNGLTNSLISAQMIQERYGSAWSKSHDGLPADWAQCQEGWNGTNDKSKYWGQATMKILALRPQEVADPADANRLYSAASAQFAVTT